MLFIEARIYVLTFLIILTSGCDTYHYPVLGNCVLCVDGVAGIANCEQCDYYPPQCVKCFDGSFLVGTDTCQSCSANCATCSSAQVCQSCQANYKMSSNVTHIYCETCTSANCDCNNSACTDCDDSYYWNESSVTLQSFTTSITVCQTCPQYCSTCNNHSYCFTCESGQYMENNLCYDCPSECFCSNETYCTSCISNYFINSSGNCQVCPQLCQCAQSSYCTSCLSGGEHNITGDCQDICGDFLNFYSPCDEGIGVDYDGCTDSCQVEDNFACKITNQKSTCSYTGNLLLQIITTTKEIFSNQLTIDFQLSPDLYLFQTVDPNSFFSFEQTSIESPQFVYNQDTSTFTVTFSYNENLHKEEVNLLFNVSTDIDLRFYATDNHQWKFTVNPDNYMQAYLYTSEHYAFSFFIYFFTIVLVALGMLVCILGIFSPKTLAGLEIMLVLQYNFIALFWFEPLTLPVYCMHNFLYSTGYNYPIYEATRSTNVPQAQLLGISTDYFVSNINAMLTFFVIALIPLLVYKIKYHRSRDYTEILQLSDKVQVFGQLTLYVVVFNLTFLITCSTMFYMYGNTSDILSLVLSVFGLLFTISTFIAFAIFPECSLRFRFSFRFSTLAFLHYFFHIICIVSSVLLLLLLTDSPWTPLIPQGLMLVYTLINQPYQKKKQNFRSAFNYLIICLITSMRLYFWLINQSEHQSWGSYIYPGLIELFIFIAIVWAYVVVIRGIIKRCNTKDQKNLAHELFDDDQAIKKMSKNLLKSDFFKAKNILGNFSPVGKKLRPKEMVGLKEKEKMSDSSTPKMIRNQKEMKEWLKSQNLPGTSQAMEMITNEVDFLRYQQIWMKKDYYADELNEEDEKIYDAI